MADGRKGVYFVIADPDGFPVFQRFIDLQIRIPVVRIPEKAGRLCRLAAQPADRLQCRRFFEDFSRLFGSVHFYVRPRPADGRKT